MANPKPNTSGLKPAWSASNQPEGAGKARGSRNRLQTKFLMELADDFEENGKEAIQAMRMNDPSGYVKAVASLMPKQFEQTEPLEDLTDAELIAGIEHLRGILAASTGVTASQAPKSKQTKRLPTVQ